jgi:AraC-like DNA-binding protein
MKEARNQRGTSVTRDSSYAWETGHTVDLLTTRGFKVAEFRCPAKVRVSNLERTDFPEIVIPRMGSYLRSDDNGEVLLNRTTLAFFEANKPYQIRHFRSSPDVTTVIAITDAKSLHTALGVQLPLGRAFARSAVRMPAGIMLAHRAMLKELARGVDGSLAAEEIATGIVLKSLSANIENQHELTRPKKASQGLSDQFAYAEQVIEMLSTLYSSRVTLDEIAKAIGLSTFHLCRVFQAATKHTIHQHLLSVRLEAAAAELLDGRKSVTEVAHGVGFSSHSHLTALFKKRFGVPPSHLRHKYRRRFPVDQHGPFRMESRRAIS